MRQLRLELQKKSEISLIKQRVSNYKHNSEYGTGNVNKQDHFFMFVVVEEC